MPIRITGMNSGLDTEAIIAEMVSGQKAKVDKLKKAQTLLQWKQESWKTLNSKIYKLFNTSISNMRYQAAYAKKTTKVSNSAAISVITGKDAVNGVQSLTVEKLAKEGYLTGSKVNGNVTNATKLSDLENSPLADGGSGVINVTVEGRSYDVTLNAEDTIGDVAAKLKKTGINANFDVKNQRFYVSSQESGVEGDFSLTASNDLGNQMLSSLGLKASLDSDEATRKEYQEYAAYYVAGDRSATLANMRGLMDQESALQAASYKESYVATKKSIADLNKNIKGITDKEDYDNSKTLDEWKAEEERLTAELEGMEDGPEKDAKQKELQNAQKQSAYANTMKSYTDEMTALQNTQNNNLAHIAVTEDADGNVTDAVATGTLTGEIEDSFYNKAEYARQVIDAYVPGSDVGTGATKITGQNAVITLNGETYEGADNVFEINGLTFTALDETEGEKVTVTTEDDTDGIYDMIKGFIKEYSGLVNEMDKLYNADSTKGYEPLTSEEKDAMSDTEAEKYEEKIKNSILRRDSGINDLESIMKEVMMSGIEVGGKTMYLSDFGINTLGYFNSADNEHNAYHINGDPDDAVTSNEEDQLKGMIAADPDTVMDFFTELSKTLYDKMNAKMSASEYSSIYTAYDDKQMKKDYDEYTKQIAEQEKKVTALEDKWYRKFSAMETALAKLQSNQNALSGLLGGS